MQQVLFGDAPGESGGAVRWRFFRFGEIHEAEEWARNGGLAVHDTGFPFRHYKLTAHLFAASTRQLVEGVRIVGANPKWLQYPGTKREHFDLMGVPLDRAVRLCDNGTHVSWCNR